MTERLHFHFSLSCIGGRNGNPLQCSCLENPRDRGAWWAAISGVAHSWTRLKWLSSSSNCISSAVAHFSVLGRSTEGRSHRPHTLLRTHNSMVNALRALQWRNPPTCVDLRLPDLPGCEILFLGPPRWLSGQESACQRRRRQFNPWVVKIPQRRKWQSTPAFLSGKSQGQRSLVGTVHGVAKTWTQLSDWGRAHFLECSFYRTGVQENTPWKRHT